MHPLLFTLLFLSSNISALGINCRGSGLCPRATFNNNNGASIIQVLRDVVWASPKSNSTTYNAGDHIVCISQNEPITISPSFAGPPVAGVSVGGSIGLSGTINEGGICLFPQGTSLTLGQIRPLTDAILDHKCSTCGSVPIHFVDQGSNDPAPGILTFNYVAAPTCDRSCISDLGSSGSKEGSQQAGSVSSAAPTSLLDQSAPQSQTIAQTSAADSTLTAPAGSSTPVDLVTVTENSRASDSTFTAPAGPSASVEIVTVTQNSRASDSTFTAPAGPSTPVDLVTVTENSRASDSTFIASTGPSTPVDLVTVTENSRASDSTFTAPAGSSTSVEIITVTQNSRASATGQTGSSSSIASPTSEAIRTGVSSIVTLTSFFVFAMYL